MTNKDAIKTLTTYMNENGSSAQTLDRYVVEDLGIPVEIWAVYRDTSEGVIRQNINRAKNGRGDGE